MIEYCLSYYSLHTQTWVAYTLQNADEARYAYDCLSELPTVTRLALNARDV